MSKCDSCKHNKSERWKSPCFDCKQYQQASVYDHYEPLTRYEKIMADMNIEEMAELGIRWSDVDRYWHNDIPDAIYCMSEDAIQAEIAWLMGCDE